MLNKLALLNAKRSFKDYLIYMITVIISFGLIFAFDFVVFSGEIAELSRSMSSFKFIIMFVGLLVAGVIGWLIHYTMKFMFEKRSKEFGMYMVLGTEKKKITNLFLKENLILGLLGFVIAFFVGIVLSQFLTAIIMNVFELPYKISSNISLPAILLTFGYFVLIYFVVLLNNRRRIEKMKIHDLLYYEKKNETVKVSKKMNRVRLLVISILSGIVGFILFHSNFINSFNAFTFLISIVLFIVSIYGISISFSAFLLEYVLKRNKLKYKNQNLFIVRNHSSKINTMGMTIGTLSLLIFLTFISLNVSNLFNGIFQTQILTQSPYDVTIYSDEANFNPYLEVIKKDYNILETFQYNIYSNNETTVRSKIKSAQGFQSKDAYIKVSDYNKLTAMLGRKGVTLNDNQYALHAYAETNEELIEYDKNNKTLEIAGKVYHSAGVSKEHFSTVWALGSSMLIIVPDHAITNFEVIDTIMHVDTKEETTEKLYTDLAPVEKMSERQVEVKQDNETISTTYSDYLIVQGQSKSDNRSMITIISFSLMYLAFIFTATTGTILAIQSLSDSTKYKFRYSILHKLGVSKSEIQKTVLKQLLLYFVFPVIYPIVLAVLTTVSLNAFFGSFLSASMLSWVYLLFSLATFLFVYIIYFVAAYVGFRKNIEE